jgi:heat shock protein HslJ
MRQLTIAIAIGAIAVISAACTSTGGSSGAPASPGASASAGSPGGGTGGTIDGIQWRLTKLPQGGSLVDVPAGVVADARFEGGRVAGNGGCNQFTGPATVDGAGLKVGPLASTEMACPGAAGDVERVYLSNLAAAASFTATADALTIYDANGAEILAYAAGAANPLVGEWNVTGYNNGKQAVVSPVAGTTLTATFTESEVSGSSGCNTFTGSYTLDGDKLTVGPLASTMKACVDDAVMDQEAQFLTALQTPTTVEVNGATVTLRADSGETQVVLAPQ